MLKDFFNTYDNKNIIIFYFFVFYFFLGGILHACIYEEFDNVYGSASVNFKNLPKETRAEILSFLEPIDIYCLRQSDKTIKSIIDLEYLNNKRIKIDQKCSSPSIECIKDLPFKDVSLSYEIWKEEDLEKLLFFKKVEKLYLKGLWSYEFSAWKLFNLYPCAYLMFCLTTVVNFTSTNLLGMELVIAPSLYSTVTSLDLSNSTIGDYGVICFISKFKILKNLNISNDDIGRNIIGEVDSLCNINTLVSLNISKNRFSNDSVEKITKLTNLTFLNVSHNQITDDSIITLTQLPNLRDFINEKNNNCLWY